MNHVSLVFMRVSLLHLLASLNVHAVTLKCEIKRNKQDKTDKKAVIYNVTYISFLFNRSVHNIYAQCVVCYLVVFVNSNGQYLCFKSWVTIAKAT